MLIFRTEKLRWQRGQAYVPRHCVLWRGNAGVTLGLWQRGLLVFLLTGWFPTAQLLKACC